MDAFRHIIAADFEFEFGGHDGNRPRPVCMVARDLRTNQEWRLWRGEFGSAPPFPIGPDALFIAYYASAELGCFKALGWQMPANVLDLFVEFRNLTNGRETIAGAGLLGALVHFGLDHINAEEKDEMRELILHGDPDSRRADVLDYCASDISALERLFPAMLPRVDLDRALIRGRYMKAVALMEWHGVPIDTDTLSLLQSKWTDIQDQLIAAIDADYGVYDGRSFKADWWERYLIQNNIPWPRHPSGALDLSDGTFRQMAKSWPQVSPIRELHSSLSDLRLNKLRVGQDGRNRTLLSVFRSRTGRNQPSNNQFIFGPAVWLRSLIKPEPGYGLAYIDWSQQEFGIAAALSGDAKMQEAYLSGDPYLAFAKLAGAVPADATKQSHGPKRELFKQCVLAVQYGMEAESLAARIGQPTIAGRELLLTHRQTFRPFWSWSDRIVNHAMLTGGLHTTFGWQIRLDQNPNPRSLRNFPMQANGAEMLRLACCFATERGIEICAPVHDAVLINAPLDRLDADIAIMRQAMADASNIVLDGFELQTDIAQVVRYPDRFVDARGTAMWRRVIELCNSTNSSAEEKAA